MVENLSPQQIYDFIVKDFRAAWDSIANNSDESIGRGNFMFARQAMSLLEFAARSYGNDDNLHRIFSEKLVKGNRIKRQRHMMTRLISSGCLCSFGINLAIDLFALRV